MQRPLMGLPLVIAGLVVAGSTTCNTNRSVVKPFAPLVSVTPEMPPPPAQGFFWPDTMHHDETTCGPVAATRNTIIPPDAASWRTWAIPEFQDKQRFVTGQSTAYGPIACVAANPQLESLDAAAFASPILVAVVFVDPGTLTAAYTQLKLHNGFNCVYLQHSTAGTGPSLTSVAALGNTNGRADSRWTGFVVASHDKICDPIGPQSQLQAISLEADGADGSAYPGVARFMILESWRPAIGMRCGSGWCVVGAANAGMLPAPAHLSRVAGATGRRKTMLVVPGWYDEQHVAIPSATGVGIAAALKASIVPDSGLDSFTITTDFDTGFVRVATIHFKQGPSAKYSDNFQFHNDTLQPDTLYLRHITTGTAHWVARVNHNSRFFRVLRTPHPEKHVTGTARWAWRDNDEVIWVRCEDGCCLVDSNWSSSMSSIDGIFKRGQKSESPG